jgi:hypothetical protein
MTAKRTNVIVEESSKMPWSDFLSVPKIIGIGPIMMAPPPLALSFLEPEQ